MTAIARFHRLCAEAETSGPVPEPNIAAAEAALGLSFPPDYRAILARYGAILGEGLEVFGLPCADPDAPPLWQDVVEETRALRALGQAGTERPGLLPISDDGTGVYFFLDTEAETGDGTARILAIGQGWERVYTQPLHDFLMDLAENRIAF